MSKKWITISPPEIALLESVNERDPDKALTGMIGRFSKTQKKITVASAKAKGRNLQQWVCGRISGIIGLPYNQADDQCLIHSREMGQSGKDIILRGEAKKLFPYSIECKASESLNVKEVIDQVKANTDDDEEWIVVHRRKAVPETLAIMAWDTFERLVRK